MRALDGVDFTVCTGEVYALMGENGAGMGGLIYFFELPPFLVTLGGMFLMRGLRFSVHAESLSIKAHFYTQTLPALAIPVAPRIVIPCTALCLSATVLAAALVAVFTRFGRNVYIFIYRQRTCGPNRRRQSR